MVGTTTLNICWKNLACAVIIRAAIDASLGDRGARAWLLDQETADTWGVLAEMNWDEVVKWVRDGRKVPKWLLKK